MTSKSPVVHKLSFPDSMFPLKKLLGPMAMGFLFIFSGEALSQVVINEVDYDQTGTDTAEFIEIRNNGDTSVDLSTYSLEIVNGNGGGAAIATTISLNAVSLAAGDYFVVCANAANTVNCDQDVSPDSNLIQNGAPDAVGLRNGTALVDAVSYEGDTGAPYTEGSGVGLVDSGDGSISRIPDGNDTDQNNVDFYLCPITPGLVNVCVIPDAAPSVTSTSPADNAIDVLVTTDITVTFSEEVTAPEAAFSISCDSSGAHLFALSNVTSVFTLDPTVDFNEAEKCTVTVFKDEVADTDADDPPDNMTADYVFTFTTPGNVVEVAELVINEIDYDQPGSDTGEFIEIRNNSADPVGLLGYAIELVNGSNGAQYKLIDLPDVMLAAGEYFVICGDPTVVPHCDLDSSTNTDLVQNGAPDGMALVKEGVIVDAVSYEGDMSPPYIEGSGVVPADSNSIGYIGISRTPDGSDTNDNNVDFELHCITPGKANSPETTACEDPRPPALKVNEIDYDQPGTDTAEFVEIFNAGNSSANLSNVDLILVNGNGAAIYQTFNLPDVELAAGDYFVVCANAANVANCDLDVSPDSNLIQNGAPDAVAILVGGEQVDTVSYEGDTGLPYTEGSGSGLEDSALTGQDNLGISRFPGGVDTDQNNVDLIYACITPGFANTSLSANCAAGGPVLEIHDIQGSGAVSPVANQGVTTLDNIVTAVGPEGFFIQTPDNRLDADPQTSNGLYVFTGSAPSVLVGDQVDVSGQVVEFFEFTEFSAGSITSIDSSGNPLPAAINLDALTPSGNPASPSCTAGALECFEGMRAEISGGAVTSANQGFGSDPIAEVFITASGNRTFREPGVAYPGIGGSIPTWDGNPEVFELDPDKLGLPNAIIPGGSRFTASGVIGFEFSGYELWPTSLGVVPADLPRTVRSKNSGETTIGSFNLFRFATDGDYATRLTKLSRYIRTVLNSPDILAVEEADNIGALQDLADLISLDDGEVNYTPYLIEGNDVGGIDVGFMVRSDVSVDSITQLGKDEIFSYDGSLLNDRPPLLLEGRYTGNGADFPLAVMVVHNRSLNGIETERVQLKRLAQAESVAEKVQTFQLSNPDTPLIVVGDYNAYEFTDGFADIVGHIKGDFNPAESLQSGLDLVNPNLTNQVDLLPANERYSFVFEGNAQALDHALTSQSAEPWVRGLQYGRGNSDAAEVLFSDPSTAARSSDHDGLVLFLMTDFDGDGVADDADGCPMNDNMTEWSPDTGCSNPIPSLGPAGLLVMLLMLGGLGVFTLRHPHARTSSYQTKT